jgi:hypothetical protein
MMAISPADTEADIWERVIHPRGRLSKQAARRILDLEFTDDDRARMHDLAARNRCGELTEDEEAELDHFCRVGTLLSILKIRAQRVLKSRSRKS